MTMENDLVELADALSEFSDIDEAEGGNPHVIATERAASVALRTAALRIQALEAALKPFSDIAKEVATHHPGWDHDEFQISRGMSFRHFRAARSALEESTALKDNANGQ